PVELDARSLDAGHTVECGHEHLEPLLRGRDHESVLLPRIACRNHEHAIESELVKGRAGVHQVADVNRIERAAEDPDLLTRRGSAHRPSLRRTLREPCVTRARAPISTPNLPS